MYLDNDFFESMGIFPSPTITVCEEHTTGKAKDFLNKHFEGHHSSKQKISNQSSLDVVEGDEILNTINCFKKDLEDVKDEDWKDWKYLIEIKVNTAKEIEDHIYAEVNILQAAVIKQDIEKVKCITSMALDKEKGCLDYLLQAGMKCKLKGMLEKHCKSAITAI